MQENLHFDFHAFPASEGPARISFTASLTAFEPPPGLRETFRGPFGVCFEAGSVRYIRYPGEVWLKFDYEQEHGEVYCPDRELLYERLYLSVLSRVGEKLEQVGLHRIHGLALDSPFGTALFLMRSGVGKSALGHSLLQREGWSLLSEDTPLLDHRGRVHPFPFRLGVRDLGGQRKQLIKSTDFDVCREARRCKFLFTGAWITGPEPGIQALEMHKAAYTLLRDGVVGLGIPQVAELFLRMTFRDALRKTRYALGRALAVAPLLRVPRHVLYLTQNNQTNADFVEDFMRLKAGGP